MQRTLADLLSKGVEASTVCFVIHRFIPASASAWAYAEPHSQLVLVDSLWGVPDGLQFLPHDSFEYDVKRRKISSERLRHKPKFIQEMADGSWQEIRVARRFTRHRSLLAGDVREVATQTWALAQRLCMPVQVMWFCGIPDELGIGRNLPWFKLKGERRAASEKGRISPARHKQIVRNMNDLHSLRDIKINSVIALDPTVANIRDNNFLEAMIELSKARHLSVELHGSSLGHAFYTLERAGITTIPSDESGYSRVRGRRIDGRGAGIKVG